MLKGLRHKSVIFKFDILVLLLCLGGLYQSAEKAGLSVQLNEKGGKIVVEKVKPASDRQMLHPGDIILSVNGQAVSVTEDVEFIMDGQAIGNDALFSIQRNGRTETVSVRLQAVNSPFYLFILALVGFIFLALGVFVLKQRPDGDLAALLFHWISVTVCLHILTTFGRYSLPPLYLGYVMRLVFLLASALTPALFVHFSYLFPRKKWPLYHKYLKALYFFALLFFLYISLLFLQASHTQSIPVFHRFLSAYNLGRWLFALSFIFAVGNFIHSYSRAIEEAERRKLRWVILGLAIGPLVFVLFWQIPQILRLEPLLPEEIMLIITALTPLTFAISIVRYHLLDIDFIFNRSTVYLIVLTFLLVIYAAIVGLAAMMVQMFTVRASLLVSAAAAVIVAVLFEPLRKAAQKFVDKRFSRVRYDYRLAQREFTQRLNLFFDIQALSDFIINKLDELLRPERLALFLTDKPDSGWRLAAGKNLPSVSAGFIDELETFSQRTLSPLIAVSRFMEPGINFWPAAKEIFKQNQIVLALPVRLQNAQNAGFLLLGKKKSAALYCHEDIDLLKTIIQQTASAIERIRLQRDLILKQAETEHLDQLNRLKSYFVSSVSHDLQTPLTSIRMFVELLQNKEKLPAREHREYLEIIKGESERLSRLIRNVLDFSRLERGVKIYDLKRIDLCEAVHSVLHSMKYQLRQRQFTVIFKFPGRKSLFTPIATP